MRAPTLVHIGIQHFAASPSAWQRLPSRFRRSSAKLGRAHETHGRNISMCVKRVSTASFVAVHEVEEAVGQAGLVEPFRGDNRSRTVCPPSA